MFPFKSSISFYSNLYCVQDCEDPNPLIRALAVRTMGCIRLGPKSADKSSCIQNNGMYQVRT